MHLVIVESPTKARKLSSYLGSEYRVEASVGHIRDLPKKKLGVDIENNFQPEYEVDADKKDVVKKLTDLATKADVIYLATDPDREGEAIAWHIQYLLDEKAKGKTFKRATFHEITKSAVMDAIANPSQIRLPLVDAQQARRVLDRLVGYKVSPVLWKKVRRGLSAGRVQSVALRLIVEREREIEAFKPEEYWELDVALSTSNSAPASTPLFIDGKVREELPADVVIARVVEVAGKKFEPTTEADVTGVTEFLPQAAYQVQQVERKERSRVSLPPFTTSTLQQVAATRLGFTSKQTMRLAQQLYEEGLITYHRTDSVNLSTQAVSMARDYIGQQYGSTYVPASPRHFANKSKNAQEAHEAIRVTDLTVDKSRISQISSRFSDQHERLYDLIWRRFVASQMQAAVYDQTTILVAAKASGASSSIQSALLRTSGSVLTFDGWMKLFPAGDDTLLPAVTEGQPVHYQELNAAQKFTQPPPRYNDASLVKELEKRGIGRPSTYASIISVLEDRAYVSRDAKRFVATPVGMTVSDFLLQHFPNIMDYDFTAGMEDDLDAIARGEQEWHQVISTFYTPLAEKIKTATDTADRAEIPVEKTGEPCPKCQQGEVVLRTGKFGKFRSCSRFPDCDFSENYFEKVDNVVCPLCQEGEVIIRQSRWGKQFFGCSRYPKCDWADWKQPEPGARVTPEEWKVRQEERAARKEARAQKGSPTKAKSSTTRRKISKKKSPKKASKKTTKK